MLSASYALWYNFTYILGSENALLQWKHLLETSFCCGFDQNCIVNSAQLPLIRTVHLTAIFLCHFANISGLLFRTVPMKPFLGFFTRLIFAFSRLCQRILSIFMQKWNQRLKNTANLGEDYTILSLPKADGHYVGTYLAVTSYEPYCRCEGELKFYIDGDLEYPTICGTGTEDYFWRCMGFWHST